MDTDTRQIGEKLHQRCNVNGISIADADKRATGAIRLDRLSLSGSGDGTERVDMVWEFSIECKMLLLSSGVF